MPQSNNQTINIFDDIWGRVLVIFIIANILSLILFFMLRRNKFNIKSAGNSNDDAASPFQVNSRINEELKGMLDEKYNETTAVLGIWKKQAWIYGSIHYYVVLWTSIIALSIPFFIQVVPKSSNGYLLVQAITAYSAITYGLHAVFRVQKNYQRYRLHESSVYTLVRNIKDNPTKYGKDNYEIYKYFAKEIENIRKEARSDEIDNCPAPKAVQHTEV